MTEFLKQDIFFFVTTIAVIVLSLLMIVVMIYVWKIVSDIKYITKKARREADLIADDIADLRENIRERGFKWRYVFRFFNNLWKKK